MAVITQPASQRIPKFGGAPNNANREPVGHANYFQTNDATPANNLLSPQTLGTGATTLVIPTNAVSVTLIASAACQISEKSDMSQFFTLPANVPVTLDVARLANLYANAPTGTPALSFLFQTI